MMDSTGSIQSSSSCGGQEYDSTSHLRGAGVALSNPPPPNHVTPTHLDGNLHKYLDGNNLHQSPVWSTPPTTTTPTITSSVEMDPLFITTNQNKAPTPASNSNTKNPKKRTRASRRAPTTVLTTDTTNFRAMVQEFTGVPSPSFFASASSPSFLFPRTTNRLHHSTFPLLVSSLSSTTEQAPAVNATATGTTSIGDDVYNNCLNHQQQQQQPWGNLQQGTSTTTGLHKVGIGFVGDDDHYPSATSLPAVETSTPENFNRLNNTTAGHHHHRQELQLEGMTAAAVGMNTIESWLCSSSTSTG